MQTTTLLFLFAFLKSALGRSDLVIPPKAHVSLSGDCILTGSWQDNSGEYKVSQSGDAVAATPVGDPGWHNASGTLTGSNLTMTFSSGNTLWGLVVAGCSTINWSNNAKWARTQPSENITTVHVVFMTHLDIGFTKLARDVCEQYFFQHYPRGISLSQELRQMGGAARYAVTTHPWLIQEYLDAATQCAHTTRNDSMIKLMTDAIAAEGEYQNAQFFMFIFSSH